MGGLRRIRIGRFAAMLVIALSVFGGDAGAVDGEPPLVVIHVKILEVQRAELSALGFDWSLQPILAAGRGLSDRPALAQLLEAPGTTVLTRPSAITNSGNEANFEIGGAPDALRDVNLTLDVLPTLSGDRSTIELRTVLRVSSLPMSEGGAPMAPRRLEDTTSLENGGSLVIGGALDPPPSDVPFLGDLPVVGSLFRREAGLAPETLLILITPWTTRPDGKARTIGPSIPRRVHTPKYTPRPGVEVPKQPNLPGGGPRYPHGPSDRVQP